MEVNSDEASFFTNVPLSPLDVELNNKGVTESDIYAPNSKCNGEAESSLNTFVHDSGAEPLLSGTSDDEDFIIYGSSSQATSQNHSQTRVNDSWSSSHCRDNFCNIITFAAMAAALGGVLFGYDIGVISGALLLLRTEMCLDCFEQEIIVSMVLVGAIVGSIFGGFIVDFLGRRIAIILNDIIFIVGALTLAFSPSFSVLIFGRLIVGFSVALSAIAECVYIAEIAPPSVRGSLVSINEFGITLGFLSSYLVSYIFISFSNGWRWMFGLSSVLALIQAVCMFFLPESPRFHISKRHESKAERELSRLRPTKTLKDVKGELKLMKLSLNVEKTQSTMDLFRSKENMRSRLFMALGLILFLQFTGQPNVLSYAPVIFRSLGFSSNIAATLNTIGLGIVKVVLTAITLLFIDRFGRRKFLLTGSILMAISITFLAISTAQSSINASSTTTSRNSSSSFHESHYTKHHLCSSSFNKTSCNVKSEQSPSPSEHMGNIKNGEIATITKYHRVLRKPVMVDGDGTNYNSVTTITFNDNRTTLSTVTIISLINESSSLYKSHLVTTTNSSAMESSLANESVIIEEATTTAVDLHSPLNFWHWIALVSLMLYVAGFAISFGPVVWLILSEIFPTSIKGRAISLATVLNYGSNLIISSTFLGALDQFGVTAVFFCYGVICFTSFIFIFFFVPETKGLSLEQIGSKLNKSSAAVHGFKNLHWLLNACGCLRFIPRRWQLAMLNRYSSTVKISSKIRYNVVDSRTVIS